MWPFHAPKPQETATHLERESAESGRQHLSKPRNRCLDAVRLTKTKPSHPHRPWTNRRCYCAYHYHDTRYAAHPVQFLIICLSIYVYTQTFTYMIKRIICEYSVYIHTLYIHIISNIDFVFKSCMHTHPKGVCLSSLHMSIYIHHFIALLPLKAANNCSQGSS